MGKNRYNNSGQVLLLVLLSMAAMATLTLSVVSRSVSEVTVTTREEESLRAFSAAEAGIEEALVTGTLDSTITRELEVEAPQDTAVVSTYKADITSFPADPRQFAYPFELISGETATIWFVSRDENNILPCGGGNTCFNGTLNLCWGKPGASADPAVFANVIYSTPSGFTFAPVGFDRNASRRQSNHFASANSGCTIDGQNFTNRASINLSSLGVSGTPVLMRVTMLYNESVPHSFGVSAGSPFPSQGRMVSSEGKSGETVRKINAFLLNPEIPFIFDAAIYSDGDIAK